MSNIIAKFEHTDYCGNVKILNVFDDGNVFFVKKGGGIPTSLSSIYYGFHKNGSAGASSEVKREVVANPSVETLVRLSKDNRWKRLI
jgi:hypothetical protein